MQDEVQNILVGLALVASMPMRAPRLRGPKMRTAEAALSLGLVPVLHPAVPPYDPGRPPFGSD